MTQVVFLLFLLRRIPTLRSPLFSHPFLFLFVFENAYGPCFHFQCVLFDDPFSILRALIVSYLGG